MAITNQESGVRGNQMKLIGNRVLLLRVETAVTASGFIRPDVLNQGQIVFRCLDVGPGEWLRPRRKPPYFIKPEVQAGQLCVSQHWSKTTEYPHWHAPQYLDYEDGRGRVILDARFCWLAWWPPIAPVQFHTQTHFHET
jgi:hypothetical protein